MGLHKLHLKWIIIMNSKHVKTFFTVFKLVHNLIDFSKSQIVNLKVQKMKMNIPPIKEKKSKYLNF